MFILSLLHKLAPAPSRIFTQFGENRFASSYRQWWVGNRDKLIAFHRKELRSLDDIVFLTRESDSANTRANAIAQADFDTPEMPRLIGPGTMV